MSWIAPRLWRSPASRFNGDEPLHAAEVYTPDVLAGIAAEGFDAIWMRGRLRELAVAAGLPALQDGRAAMRVASLRQVIHDAEAAGLRVFLFFNEPLALPRTDPFWDSHPALRGEAYAEPDFNWDVTALCTSHPDVQAWLRDAVATLYNDLPGLGGVILITASEFHTHCWSHKARRAVGDAYIDKGLTPMDCPRCRDREPADVVAELVAVWAEAARTVARPPEVWVWNWSWSMWYAEAEQVVVPRLPDGVKLLADFERGGERTQAIGRVFIDEYALGYPGPSARFLAARAAAQARGLPVCAKLQLNVTHELATVPNLPLIPCLFEKWARLSELGVSGLMGSWNFGNSVSLNTRALRLFMARPDLRREEGAFCRALAQEAFPGADPERIVSAWRRFCASFHEYPFSLKMLYLGPMNYAVSYPLSLTYRARAMGPSWEPHGAFGDRLEDCLGPFTLDQVIMALTRMEALWGEGIRDYAEASDVEQACATMIGLHVQALRNIFQFHRWRCLRMQAMGCTGPCRLPPDVESGVIMRQQIAVMKAAGDLVSKYPAFGYHQEPGAYLYSSATITQALAEMEADLAAAPMEPRA